MTTVVPVTVNETTHFRYSPASRRLVRQLALSISLLGVAAGAAPQASAASLPQPSRSLEDAQKHGATLYLELLVNQRPTSKLVAVQVRDGHYLVDADELRDAGLPLPAEMRGPVAIDSIPQVQSHYDAYGQRLLVDVPPDWLPGQTFGGAGITSRIPAQTSLGAMFNYDLYTSAPEQGRSYSSAWTDLRLFGAFGSLHNSGVYQHAYGDAQGMNEGYLRYDTGWRTSDEERMITYELGDLVTNALPWSSPVRVGGLQIARDFSVRPDVVTYPLPQFSGEAAVPTTVDLFVNGYRSSSTSVDPGPFTITNVPFINGAGNAVVVTTDALGRQVSTTVPFYVTSSLLKPGLSDYSFASGTLRRDYGLKSFSYGPAVANGSYRYGLNDYLTLESHAEGADDLALGGLGAVLRLGNLGTLNLAASHGGMQGDNGEQRVVGYQYNGRRFNFSLQRIERDSGFADLSVYDLDDYQLSRKSTQTTSSLSLERWGSVGVGYFDIEAADHSRTRLLNLSWSKPLWGNANLYLSANREIGDSNWTTALLLSIPFDLHGTLGGSIERNADKRMTRRINYSRSIPSDGGFGWDLGYTDADDADSYRQASLSWRGDSLQLQGGAYGNAGDYTRWLDMSGSVVWMDNALFAANRVPDAFVLVSTDGQPEIPVRYENQLVGSTDANGHLLVPWATAYYGAKYEIDPLNLPSAITTPEVEKRVAVKAGSGYLLRFPVQRVAAASVILRDAAGKNLPVGALVRTVNGQEAYVGWDGRVYLEHLRAENRLQVELPEGGHCTVGFSLDTAQDEVALVGPLTCH